MVARRGYQGDTRVSPPPAFVRWRRELSAGSTTGEAPREAGYRGPKSYDPRFLTTNPEGPRDVLTGDVDGLPPESVAEDFLSENGFI